MLQLYDYFRSSSSFRVRIALNLKNLSYETIPVHLIKNGGEQHSEEYQQLNPQSLVPTLIDGNKTLTQSLAIIEYLDELHPEPSLLTHDPYERALIRSFALSITADIQPLNNLRVLTYLQEQLHIDADQKNLWYQHWLAKGLSALEKQLIRLNRFGHFCFGNQPTLADICLVPQIYNAKRFACDLTPYPTLVHIDNQCQKLTAFMDAWPVEPVT